MKTQSRHASLAQRLVSMLLIYAMLLTSLPVQAFAAPVGEETPIVVDSAADATSGDDADGAQAQQGEGDESSGGEADADAKAAPDGEPTADVEEADPVLEAEATDDETAADAENAGEADEADEADEAEEREEVEAELDNEAVIFEQDDLFYVALYGTATESEEAAAKAILEAINANTELTLLDENDNALTASEVKDFAQDVAAEIFNADDAPESSTEGIFAVLGSLLLPKPAFAAEQTATSLVRTGYERRGDGSDIESITLKWLPGSSQTLKDYTASETGDRGYTDVDNPKEAASREESTNNATNALLYMEPTTDSNLSVKFQLDYALSGEHNYAPGDVTIKIPAYVFYQRQTNSTDAPASRDEADYGAFLSPMLEAPSRRTDFNWELLPDPDTGELMYVFTNTKAMSAATRGFIQFQISGLTPHSLIDMKLTDEIQATMEVTTQRENTLSLLSNPLVAQVNTTQQVRSATKAVSQGYPQLVEAANLGTEVPEEIKAIYPNSTHYVVVNWYMYAYHTGNQPYELVGLDTRTDVYDETATYTNVDANGKPIDHHIGWIVAGDNETNTKDLGTVYKGYNSAGNSTYSNVRVIYPLDQFIKDTDYYFTNSVHYDLTPIDEVDAPTSADASARVRWSYSEPEWTEPVGHFNVFKWGNDNDYRSSVNDYGRPDSYGTGTGRYAPELTTHSGSSSRDDLPTPYTQHLNGYYGIYPKDLNRLREGEDSIIIGYTMKSEGYLLPWIWGGSLSEEPPATRVEENYGRRPVTMITEDTGLWVGAQNRANAKFDLKVHEDYEFLAIDFVKPTIGAIQAINVNPDGSFTALYAEDGTFEYKQDYKAANIPDIYLEIQRAGSDTWETYAMERWSGGGSTPEIYTSFDADGKPTGSPITGTTTLDLPADTDNFRTRVTSGNAYIYYYVRPIVEIKNTEKWAAYIEDLFADNNNPSTNVWNGVEMWAYEYDGDLGTTPAELKDIPAVREGDDELGGQIVDIAKNGYDKLYGYTTDISVIPYKSASFDERRDVSYENRYSTVHYTARVEERSVISDRAIYEDAVSEGFIPADTSCTWYDLLPRGANPVMSSIRMPRSGDTIKNAYTIANYNNSGRTLLVVECELTPTPTTYDAGDVKNYMDAPQIAFDATYSFDSTYDYGTDLHNVIAYESSIDELGSVPKYMAEVNNPNGTNNIRTPEAWAADLDEAAKEKDALSKVNEDRQTQSFLYAGTDISIDHLGAARTSLHKEVSVNNDNYYSQGLYYNTPEEEARDVYEGGQYSYRIRMMSDSSTKTKDIVIFDSLENFVAGHGNDEWDFVLATEYASYEDYQANHPEEEYDYVVVDADGKIRMAHSILAPTDKIYGIKAAPRWQGTLRSVDISHLLSKDVDVKVYYSTTENMKLQTPDDPTGGFRNEEVTGGADIDLANSPYWELAYTVADGWIYQGNMADVHAVAIDARYKTDGSEFILEPLDTAVVYLNMTAPTGSGAAEYIEQDAHAYNNIFLDCISVDDQTGEEAEKNFIRQDYTKVGLVENTLEIRKKWSDDNNRDGIRPESITFKLYRNGEEYPSAEYPNPDYPDGTVTLTAADYNEDADAWVGAFKHLPYCDDAGNVIRWTIQEVNTPEGYTASSSTSEDGHTYSFTNKHEPERTSVSGEKQWVVPEMANAAEQATADASEQAARPTAIRVKLYADGELQTSKVVQANSQGNWSYSFDNLLKYTWNEETGEGGELIVYTVEEEPIQSGSLDSYTSTVDGTTITNTYHPYGEFRLTKHTQGTENTSQISKDQAFTYSFVFSLEVEKEIDGETKKVDEPIFDEFEYTIFNADGSEAQAGTIATDSGTIELTAEQTVVVHELPESVKVSVSEEALDGWTAQGGTERTTEVKANKEVDVEYTNVYETSGLINLQAEKSLSGRPGIQNNQFRFYMSEDEPQVITENAGEENEHTYVEAQNIIRTAAVRADGSVIFGAIEYTNEDVGEHTYYLYELDRGRAGYSYDTSYYKVVVNVVDKGDGTMDITPTYYEKSGDDWVALSEKPEFVNKYEAKGPTTLRAWKQLEGASIKDYDGAFTFDLYEVNEDGTTTLIDTKTNDGSGTVTFDVLEYTQDDLFDENGEPCYVTASDGTRVFGREYKYVIRERTGTDPAITYTDATHGYTVTVVDNGDGNLTCVQGLADVELKHEGFEGYVCFDKYLVGENIRLYEPDETVSRAYRFPIEIIRSSGSTIVSDRTFGDCYIVLLSEEDQIADYNTHIPTSYEELMQYAIENGTPITDETFSFTRPNYSEGYDFTWIRRTEDLQEGLSYARYSAMPPCLVYVASLGETVAVVKDVDDAEMPIFTNTMNPGNLEITKLIDSNSQDYDPNQLFKFRLEIESPDMEKVDAAIEKADINPYKWAGEAYAILQMIHMSCCSSAATTITTTIRTMTTWRSMAQRILVRCMPTSRMNTAPLGG